MRCPEMIREAEVMVFSAWGLAQFGWRYQIAFYFRWSKVIRVLEPVKVSCAS
jgi:hypothetical protein